MQRPRSAGQYEGLARDPGGIRLGVPRHYTGKTLR